MFFYLILFIVFVGYIFAFVLAKSRGSMSRLENEDGLFIFQPPLRSNKTPLLS